MSSLMKSLTLRLTGAAFAAALLAPAARAQVVLSEIAFTTNAQWIEVHNAGTKDVDLSNWSIYHAASSTPGTHWYPFPAQTTIKPGAYLRVHWLAPLQANTPTDIYTGQSIHHFLFGLSAVALDPTRGALALYNTQNNSLMNNPASIQDWVSWGTTGFARESLAITAKRWTSGSFAPASTGNPLPSLAYDYTTVGKPSSAREWILDSSPTPGRDNVGNASVTVIGRPCQQSSNPSFAAALVTTGLPIKGNENFAMGIDRKLNAGEIAVQILAFSPDAMGSISFYGCPIYANIMTAFYTSIVPAVGGRAEVNYGKLGVSGVKFSSVWAVIDPNRGLLTMTNALELRFGD